MMTWHIPKPMAVVTSTSFTSLYIWLSVCTNGGMYVCMYVCMYVMYVDVGMVSVGIPLHGCW